jgi:Ca2+-binding EF-hand superfamily protein
MVKERIRVEKGMSEMLQKRLSETEAKQKKLQRPSFHKLSTATWVTGSLVLILTVSAVVLLCFSRSEFESATYETLSAATDSLTERPDRPVTAEISAVTAEPIQPSPVAALPERHVVAKRTADAVEPVQPLPATALPEMNQKQATQWEEIERSGDSQITVEELAAQMVAPQFADAIFRVWDKNKDGVVTREEFCRAEKFPMLKSSRSKVEPVQPLPAKALPAMNQEQALQWEQIERSGDSQITAEELAAQMVVPANAGGIFKVWDKNKDGVVNREEFMRVETFPWLKPRESK